MSLDATPFKIGTVTFDLGQIVVAAPDFTGDRTTVELEFETSTSFTVSVSAP